MIFGPGRGLGNLTDAQWVDGRLAGLPARWQDAIKRAWRGKWSQYEAGRQAANLAVLDAVQYLGDAQRAGLRPDADHEAIRARASVMARHFGRALSGLPVLADAVAWARRELDRSGMADFWPLVRYRKMTEAAALARVRCEVWWRRTLRRLFARTVEACSIGLGLVNKRRDCYVSNLSVQRRAGQLRASAAMMDATTLENEYGQRMKLSDLAGRSMANKAIRRAELMTRISGFDAVAFDLGHEATFITVTCPSRMHKWRDTGTAGVEPNPKFDGTTPGEAQKYLSGQWAKWRAAAQRKGLSVYGFRVAEPHHDGCPHWHLILFHKADQGEALRDLFARYFLRNDSATERGAARHRLTFERIDRSKGSAASYIAKYISKNVDGYKVGRDLYGADAVESSARVDAWASTWGIRQFQQIGGAPVTVWRELRRLNPDNVPADLIPESLTAGLEGCNIVEAGGRAAEGWRRYVMVQGGPTAKRAAHPIKLHRQDSGEINRYGEICAPDVVGVQAGGRTWVEKPFELAAMPGRPVPMHRFSVPAHAVIESERSSWIVVGNATPATQPGGAAARPRTRVNNCTRTTAPTPDGMGVRDVSIITRGKTGRFKAWKPKAGEGEPPPRGQHGEGNSGAH